MNVIFNQRSSAAYPKRNKTLTYRFFNSYEASSSWREMCDKAKVVIPKNIYVKDETGKLIPLGGTNVNIGGFDTSTPLFLKGDRVTIKAGYRYRDAQKNEVLGPTDKDGSVATIFQGFISNVTSKKPIELECEDNMWLLKQKIAPNKTYKETDTLEHIMKDMLAGTQFTVNALTSTTFGAFRTQNETVAEVLARLQKDYHFDSYFRGNELRCGAQVYVEQDAIDDGPKVFKFQHDIHDDHSLEYKRKDDVNLSAIAYSVNKNSLNVGVTKAGKTKTKHERLEVLVSTRNGSFVSQVKSPGQTADFAPNTAGERRTFFFNNVTDSATLIDLATKQLSKYYYTGLRGKFKTFGIPLVKMGDNVDILDPVLPEKNGRYKCKSVQYAGSESGLTQEIELDFLVTRLDAKGNPIS